MTRRIVLPVAALLLALPTAHAGQGVATGLLPAAGDPELAAGLDAALPRLLAAEGTKVEGPNRLAARLGAAPGVAHAVAQARALVNQAGEAILHINRAAAVKAARQGIVSLQAIDARLHQRGLLAQAHGFLALALLLKPADEEGSRQAFDHALRADPGFSPDPDRTPPRANELFGEARARQRPALAPTVTALSRVARRAGVGRLVWITARRDGTAAQLEVILYTAADQRIKTHLHKRVTAAREVDQAAAALVATGLGARRALATASQPTTAPVVVPAPDPSKIKPAAAGKRWYKRWWVWTLVGAAVAGGSVALAVGLDQSEESGNDDGFRFRFKY